MRKIATVALVFALAAAARGAHAAGPIGPPGPVISPDQIYSVEAGYFLHRATWESSADALGAKEFRAVDVEQVHTFLQGTIYPIREGECFLRVGGADFRVVSAADSFDSGARPFAAAGVRAAFYSLPSQRFFAGAVGQASLYATYSDTRRVPLSPAGEARADIHSYFDLSLGIGVQKEFAGRLIVYGGPLLFYSQAKGHVASAALGRDVKTQFKDSNNLGVFAGARLVVWRGLSVDGEVQARGETSYGFKLSYAF